MIKGKIMHVHDSGLLEILMIAVSGCYMIIAIQFFITLHSVKIKNKSIISLGALILVFVFCGLAGYIGKAFNWNLLTELILHLILLLCSVVFILTNQISVILHGLKDD